MEPESCRRRAGQGSCRMTALPSVILQRHHELHCSMTRLSTHSSSLHIPGDITDSHKSFIQDSGCELVLNRCGSDQSESSSEYLETVQVVWSLVRTLLPFRGLTGPRTLWREHISAEVPPEEQKLETESLLHLLLW